MDGNRMRGHSAGKIYQRMALICLLFLSLHINPSVFGCGCEANVLIVSMALNPDNSRSADCIAEVVSAIETDSDPVDTAVKHFSEVDAYYIRDGDFTHIIFSGQRHPWDKYDWEQLQAFGDGVFEARLPVLGICGGHQFIALYFGGEVDRIKRLDPDAEGYDGCLREGGFTEIDVVAHCPLMAHIKDGSLFMESHYDEVKELPAQFVQFASGELSQYQGIMHLWKPIYGVQFHPERYNDRHPAGKKVLENFISMDN